MKREQPSTCHPSQPWASSEGLCAECLARYGSLAGYQIAEMRARLEREEIERWNAAARAHGNSARLIDG